MTQTRNLLTLFFLLTLSGLLCAQDEAPDEGATDNTGQETELNEDNYRRFMELRDDQVQRPSQPYGALAPPLDLEKMGDLPEASQKHLRNQLRSIIVDGERWTPGETDKDYPYVASKSAETDRQLRNMEAEAWSELVDNYHAREAQIHAAGERSRVPGTNQASPGNGSDASQDSTGADRAALSADATGAAASSPEADTEIRQAGVTQNALEYLNAQTRQDPAVVASSGRGSQQVLGESGATGNSAPSPPATNDGTQSARQRAGGTGQASPEANASSAPASNTAQLDSSPAPSDTSARMAQAASESVEDNPSPETQRRADSPDDQQEIEYLSEGVIAIRDLKKLDDIGQPREESGFSSDEEEPR